MSPDFLLENFERISDAPDAVPRLRRFVLDLAGRGKLVQQDPEEEPASELIQRIHAKKAASVASGSRKKRRVLQQPAKHDAPFDLAPSWEWAAIREITSDRGQRVPDRPFHYIDVSSIDNKLGRIAESRILTAEEAPSRARKIVEKDDVIYSCVRPYLRNVAVIDEVFEPYPIVSTAFAVLDGHDLLAPRYLWSVLRSPFFEGLVSEEMRGQAYPAINDREFSKLRIPIPPLAEQHRIVAKVDELMALCDELEAAQAKRETRRDRLVAATLHRLNNGDSGAGSTEAFQQTARFYFNHLPRLTTKPEHIRQLRQTILDLTVRGKLVPQDPSEDLEAKARTGGRAVPPNNQRDDFVGLESEPPFVLPESWKWTTLGSLAESLRYGTSTKCSYDSQGIPVLRIPNVDNGKINAADLKYAPLSERDVKNLTLRAGDILIVRSNGSLSLVGRPALVEDRAVGMCYAGYLVRVRTSRKIVSPYFLVDVLTSAHVRSQIEGPIRTTVGLKNVNSSELRALTIPLPPLAEQHRIVAKVDELMVLCDELENRLADASDTRRVLLEATLQEALGG